MRASLVRLLLAAALTWPVAALAASAPGQPEKGPGGTDYVAAEVAKRSLGTAGFGSFAFHVAQDAPAPRPVVIFLHAWGATNPQLYGGWIEHLARKGNLVIWPRFQELGRTRPADATATAVELVREALEQLAQDPQARPDTGKVALVGHLAGAPLAANLAAMAEAERLPAPKLLFMVMPGGIARDPKSRGIPLQDLSKIDEATMLIAVSGDREYLAADRSGRQILKEAEAVPAARKIFMRVLSDDHGFPTLSATLASPGSINDAYDATKIKTAPDVPTDPRVVARKRQRWSADMVLSGEQTVIVNQLAQSVTDTLDYLGYWKTLDMALEAAFAGRDGNWLRTREGFQEMGRWSDGWPVRRLAADAPKQEGKR